MGDPVVVGDLESVGDPEVVSAGGEPVGTVVAVGAVGAVGTVVDGAGGAGGSSGVEPTGGSWMPWHCS
ncbi:hypothetical protein [Saccharopolyspora pogona]|uniref:hypothetical protein n=1 Tax=Saccharopolyspora pogona TaxID=333966 RepID=UPI0016820175|nr:hypothetical protein [Saccharopolyspora pogona]